MTEAHTSLYETFLKLCANKDIADKLFKDICGPLVFLDVNIQFTSPIWQHRGIFHIFEHRKQPCVWK